MSPPVATPIATARLTLEPLTVAHAAEMVDLLADPALYPFIGGGPPTLDELRERFLRMVAGPGPEWDEAWLNWIARRRDDARAVGTVQATVTGSGSRAMLAWVVDTRAQHRGYATEAAQALAHWLRAHGATTLTAHIHPRHIASQAVAKRIDPTPTDRIVGGETIWAVGPAGWLPQAEPAG